MEELIEITYNPPTPYKIGDWIWYMKNGLTGGGEVVNTYFDKVMIRSNGVNGIVRKKYITKIDKRREGYGRTN